MRYLGMAVSTALLIAFIVFFVNNSQEFRIGFLGYELARPLQLWVLMLVFFAAGTLPVGLLEIPRWTRAFLGRRRLKAEIRSIQAELARLSERPGDPLESLPDEP
jgi:uncharacterized integral membrane protein